MAQRVLMMDRDGQERITTLLFDMDNTLFDLYGAQVAACKAVAGLLGGGDGEALFSYFLSSAHGYESCENIRHYMLDRGIFIESLFASACEEYERTKLHHIVPYDQMPETLHSLSTAGYRMGIVTDAYLHDAMRRLEKTDLLRYFSCIVSCDMVDAKKPSPDVFLRALKHLEADPYETIMIGDSIRRDIEPCRLLGMQTIYAGYGDRFSQAGSPVPADFVIDAPAALKDLILSVNRDFLGIF